MGRKIVPLRPRQKEGVQEPPKPLTLADVAITWTAPGYQPGGTRTRYMTGATLALLVAQLAYKSPNPSAQAIESQMVPSYLRGMSYLVFPDPGTPNEDLDKDVRFTISEFLENAAALLHADRADAKDYRIHVGPIPKEWTP